MRAGTSAGKVLFASLPDATLIFLRMEREFREGPEAINLKKKKCFEYNRKRIFLTAITSRKRMSFSTNVVHTKNKVTIKELRRKNQTNSIILIFSILRRNCKKE